MASRERAIVNNLNERARFYGQTDMLTIEDVRAILHFYDYSSCKSGEKPATSLDHVIPLANGGTNTRDNIQVLTVPENKAKGDEEIDYRKGSICPPDYQAPQTSEKETYKKHDWDALRFEYVTGEMSLRQLADKHSMIYTLVLKRSASDGWDKQRKDFGIKLVSEANEQVKELVVERELSVRSLLFDVIEVAVTEWSTKPRANARELAELLKLGLVAQGGITERTAHVDQEQSDDAILARINQAFDPGEEGRTYTPFGDEGEESGAGWSD